jgi:flagellar biosynthesis protein FliR
MHTEMRAPVALIYSFLLVLARVSGSIIFVPLPGVRNAVEPVRVVLILAVTMTLFPVWPVLSPNPSIVEYTGWVAMEAVFGLAIGLLVGFLSEIMVLFGHMCGLQAGFSFASTVDPASQADSPVLIVIAESLAALLFVTLGLHRYVIQVFAQSLISQPPAAISIHRAWGELLIRAAGTIFSTGLRLALPIIGLMVMVDITLALLGRINSHLQLLHLAMPLKILAALATISILLALFPSFYFDYANHLFRAALAIAK